MDDIFLHGGGTRFIPRTYVPGVTHIDGTGPTLHIIKNIWGNACLSTSWVVLLLMGEGRMLTADLSVTVVCFGMDVDL